MNDHPLSHHYSNFDLLKEYILICNKALAHHKNVFPFNKMWQAIENQCQDQAVNIALLDDYPAPFCALSISKEGIQLSEINDEKTNKKCHVKLSHIKEVLKNKENYIQNPALIDWHWIEHLLQDKTS